MGKVIRYRGLGAVRLVAGTALSFVVLPLMALGGCGASQQGPGDVTEGVWVGDGGRDQFVFDLQGSAPDSLVGVVHVLTDGKKNSELVITRASYKAPDLEMYIAGTDATYRGRVETTGGRVRGGLSFGGTPGPEMELRWADPAGLPGLAALARPGRYVYREPTPTDDGWEVGSPEDVGLNREAVESLVEAVARGDAGLIHSLLVVRNGRLVLDEYFHGFGPDELHRLASVTKTVSGLLVGAALDRGLIQDLDTPLLRLLPEATPPVAPEWEAVTLHHLMSMSMGLDWTPAEVSAVHGTGPDFFRQVLGRGVVETPGTRWEYVSANVNLLAGVIFEATGMHAEAFARDVLFEPLGIRTYDWEYGKVAGYNLMDGSLHLRSRDLAKIGAMVAAGGRWKGHEVIRDVRIRELTRLHHGTGEALAGYGDLWWLGDLPTDGGSQPMIVANGWGSQFIVIFPELDMVVVTTGGNEDNGRHLDVGAVLAQYLIASM